MVNIMEFPNLGEKCGFPECKTLDFLPLRCKFCEGTFCKAHLFPDEHLCEKNDDRRVTDNPPTEKFAIQCSLSDCKNTELVEIICPLCSNHYCLGHRHIEDHNCPVYLKKVAEQRNRKLKITEAALVTEKRHKELDKNVVENLNKLKSKSAKSQQMANKVLLMKLKQQAKGMTSLPQEERIYFTVHPPADSGKPIQPLFVSKSWMMSKVINCVATQCKIEISKTGPRLNLFRKSDGRCLTDVRENTLGELNAKHEVCDGDELILEYGDHLPST